MIERSGALQEIGENVDKLLPQDELERRQKDEWKARWAINVRRISRFI